jgi:hypothetical protein
MRTAVTAAVAAALLSAAACAPVIEGGPPIALPIGLQETAQIGSVTLSTGWLDAEEDFAGTFSEEVHEELSRCMWGTAPINLRVHIDEMQRAGRLETLFTGEGVHTLSGTVEFVEPATNRVLGRFPRRRGDERAGSPRRRSRRPPDDGLGRVRPRCLRTGVRAESTGPRAA